MAVSEDEMIRWFDIDEGRHTRDVALICGELAEIEGMLETGFQKKVVADKLEKIRELDHNYTLLLSYRISHRTRDDIASMLRQAKFGKIDREDFRTKLWYLKGIFGPLSEEPRACDLRRDILEPKIELSNLEYGRDGNISFRMSDAIKYGMTVFVNPAEISLRVVNNLLFNSYRHGVRNAKEREISCDYDDAVNGMYGVSILNASKKRLSDKKIKAAMRGVKLDPRNELEGRFLGLGLPNSISVLHKYGGHLKIESFERKQPYFRVTFYLPAAKSTI